MANWGLVQIRWTRNRPSGQPAEDVAVNTIHTQVSDGGWTTDDRDTFDTAWAVHFNDLKPYISAECGPQELRFYDMPATAGPLGEPAFVVTHPAYFGTAAATSELPPQSAMTYTWKTAIRRRWGRIYIPCLCNTLLGTGRISSTALAAVGASVDTFGTTLRSNGQGIVVWHRAGWNAEDVTEFTIDDVMDVQRRRRNAHAFNRYTGSFTS